MRPPEIAGDAMNWSGSVFTATCSNFGPAFTTVIVPSLAVR